MAILYHKDDHAVLEVDRDGNYLLHVVCGAGSVRELSILLDDEELERYREWGEHFVEAMTRRVQADPAAFQERNLLATPASKNMAGRDGADRGKRWRILGGFLSALVFLSLVLVATDRPGGPGEPRRGRIVGSLTAPDESGESHYATVLLEDGSNVQVPVPGRAGYEKGMSVTVRESRSRILGTRSWRIEPSRSLPAPAEPVNTEVRKIR